MCLGFVFQFLSSAMTHLNSRCPSQAVFHSGTVDFDTEVVRTSLGRGFVQSCVAGPRARRYPCEGRVRDPTTAGELYQPRAASGLVNSARQQDGWMDGWMRQGAARC